MQTTQYLDITSNQDERTVFSQDAALLNPNCERVHKTPLGRYERGGLIQQVTVTALI